MKNTLLLIAILTIISCAGPKSAEVQSFDINQIIKEDDKKIVAKADGILNQEPNPLVLYTSDRSEGGIHDFFSEGDYWWQDPENPDGPYIRKDGLSNPANFLDHRIAMRNLNEWVSALVAAYEITGMEKYADHALLHLNAFFVNEATLMNPNLLYAQAIKGRHSGRGIGIIDTIHLIEVTRSILNLKEKKYLSDSEFLALSSWFEEYATWMNTHPYGLDEKDHGNNHSTWWAAQMASFAEISGRDDFMEIARNQFKKLLPTQMKADGSFPDELSRTKPYIYTLFNLEGYAVLCDIASKENDLWFYKGETGNIKKAFDFMMPYIKDKSEWKYPPDVSHFDEIPIRSLGLLLCGLAYEDEEILKTWTALDAEKKSEEIKRNFPLWYAINWI